MLQYTINRFVSMLVVLLVIITATFILMHSIPGGPFTAERTLPEAVLKNINERYHLNDPLWKQYTDYLTNIMQGDLGPSFKYENRTVNQIIAEGFPVSAELGALTVAIALIAGIPAGILAALFQNRWPDYATMFLATIGVSVPNFILATLFIYVFALKLELLPAAMWGGFEYMILPACSLAGLSTAFVARLVRSTMLEVMSQDYIRTARAKGLSAFLVVYRHALKNTLIPVVTYLGPQIAMIFTGSFVIETIFAIPGLGRHFVTSIYNRDYTVILGITVFYSALLVFLNFLVDIAYMFLDPRIKLDNKEEN
ncbi:MAG TPA: ABC transporter permease [Methylomusa anaerophila]|uniref:Dipeptide transport system permease protein DppB n=1 Tax=Methylomusa anaerophila TaxID=1930071 RepID=A0A348ANK7_9FIRM|nr:ABC transporter permease [Methylomusa anaerophila]BBB92655.1 dipeptide transport system permease protein DppB [Methylomusa anaerophila]HML87492.1 ABC transporter permease [Methylomusa anaerophila]